MTATAQRKYQLVESNRAAPEPLEDEHELLEEDDEPQVEQHDADGYDTCSPFATVASFSGPPARMLLKRSLSPNGHIDSVTVEIELGIGGLSAQEIKVRGLKALQLEMEITRSHLASLSSSAPLPSRTKSRSKPQNRSAEGEEHAVPAELLDIGKLKNNCHFINVKVGDKTARLFGSRKDLVVQLAKAGQDLTPEAISAGLRLNFACRAVTKPSNDGQHLHVVQLFPAA
jgi:hypothetical protein